MKKPLQWDLKTMLKQQVPLVLPGNLSMVASVTPSPPAVPPSQLSPFFLLYRPFSPHLAQSASKSPQASGSEDSAPESSPAQLCQCKFTRHQSRTPNIGLSYLEWPQ